MILRIFSGALLGSIALMDTLLGSREKSFESARGFRSGTLKIIIIITIINIDFKLSIGSWLPS